MKTPLKNPLSLQTINLLLQYENTLENPCIFHYSLVMSLQYENTLENPCIFHYSLLMSPHMKTPLEILVSFITAYQTVTAKRKYP